MSASVVDHYEQLRAEAQRYGQGHLFAFWEQLNETQRSELLEQLAPLDFAEISRLAANYVRQPVGFEMPARIEPVQALPAIPDTDALRERYATARAAGERLIALGKVAAFCVAGGQGTRLGYDGPKGCFEVTPLRRASLFQVFAEQVLATRKRYGAPIPWYIMTSPLNDAPTRAYFRQKNWFGLPENDVIFFAQGTMPAFDLNGRLLMASRHSLALSPDGHGGSLLALRRSGALADMHRRGVTQLSYFQVDNPLVRCIDPLFIGLHETANAEMSSKALPKAADKEKVGNFAWLDGKLGVIEYSDLPDALATARNPDGTRRFDAGSIAIHVLSVAFIERLTTGSTFALPWHRADKKVPCIDPETGNPLNPDAPNGVKLEAFIFDAKPLAKNPLVLQTRREEEFSPVKNADGNDSPATSRRDQVRRAARWLEAAGVRIPRTPTGDPACIIEVSPLWALDADHAAQRIADLEQPLTIKPGDERLLDD